MCQTTNYLNIVCGYYFIFQEGYITKWAIKKRKLQVQ